MQHFDFVVIGAGPAGEAAAHEARRGGASAAVLGDTMHAFPTTARVMGGLFAAAAHRLEGA